jgi:hypothetical protein
LDQATAAVRVPVCRRCLVNRSVRGVIGLLLLLLTPLVAMIAAVALGGGPAVLLALGVLFVVMLAVGVAMGRMLDRRYVGVRVTDMSEDATTITLRFRDQAMAVTVAELTERRRAAQVAAAKGLLDGR